MEWYPENREELDSLLNRFILKSGKKKINGIIVPHARYIYSGEVAGKAYSIAGNFDKAVIIGPSHSSYINDIVSSDKEELETPLGKIKLLKNGFKTANIHAEHSINNQIPFLQKLNPNVEVLPLMVGDINNDYAGQIAEKLAEIKALFVFSTDLSHFLSYDKAVEKDRKTIEIIESLDFERFNEIDACGKNGLLILFHLCKIKAWKPKLIEYKNSGDVTGDKSSVVGYACFYF